jgi:hypothetical protein
MKAIREQKTPAIRFQTVSKKSGYRTFYETVIFFDLAA